MSRATERDVFDFPPLFTLQPNETSRRKQLEIWRDVLTSNKVFMITKGCPVFRNTKINRELDPYAVHVLCDFLGTLSLGEWVIQDEKFLFYQRPIIEWADQLHRWVGDTGRYNSVETLFSIMKDLPPEIFASAPIELVYRMLTVLERSRKCEVIVPDTDSGASFPNLETVGVKFFPMVLPGVVVSRFVYEVSSDSGLPPRIFACAMMLYHAFVEYVSEEGSLLDADYIMVGITSLVLSLKFNENYLNTVIEQVNDPVPSKSRSMKVIDSAARAIVSYGQSHNAKGLTTEQLVQVKEKIKAGVCELSMLRIFGNFATSIPVVPGTDSMAPLDLVREYSSPQCLGRWT